MCLLETYLTTHLFLVTLKIPRTDGNTDTSYPSGPVLDFNRSSEFSVHPLWESLDLELHKDDRPSNMANQGPTNLTTRVQGVRTVSPGTTENTDTQDTTSSTAREAKAASCDLFSTSDCCGVFDGGRTVNAAPGGFGDRDDSGRIVTDGQHTPSTWWSDTLVLRRKSGSSPVGEVPGARTVNAAPGRFSGQDDSDRTVAHGQQTPSTGWSDTLVFRGKPGNSPVIEATTSRKPAFQSISLSATVPAKTPGVSCDLPTPRLFATDRIPREEAPPDIPYPTSSQAHRITVSATRLRLKV